jgi:hypothetical protein
MQALALAPSDVHENNQFFRVCPTFYMRRNFEILIKTVEQILFDPVPDNCHLPLYTPE